MVQQHSISSRAVSTMSNVPTVVRPAEPGWATTISTLVMDTLHLDDFHICTLRHLFAHCATAATAESLATDTTTLADLRAFFADWRWLGPGVFTGTDFNAFATSPSRLSVLHSIFDLALVYLDSFGGEISLSYLETHVNTQDAYFTVPQSTSIYRDAIGSLIALIPSHE